MRLSALLCLFVATAACSQLPGIQGAKGKPSLSVVSDEGVARLIRGPQILSIRSSHRLSPGDRIEAAQGDVARLSEGRGRTLELRGGKLHVVSASHYRLLSGSLLVRTSSPIRIAAGGLRASASRGVFRLDRQLATRVAVYEGGPVTVGSGPDALSVPAYRQVVTVQGILPKTVQPLRFSASDRWDRRQLSDAIDLDARVSSFAQGLEAQLGLTEGLDFFTRVAPAGFNVDFLRPHLDNRRSDLLIGLFLSAEARRLDGFPLELRFERIFRLWTQGASWGLLAQEFQVGAEPLFSQLSQAVERAQIRVIGPGPGLFQRPAVPGRLTTRRPPPSSAPRSVAPATGPQTPPSTPASGVLPPPVRAAVPSQVNQIVDDLLGVVKLPPVL